MKTLIELKKEISMKFEKNRVLLDGSIEKTRDFEGGNFWLFIQNALAAVGFDASGIKYFEVGPKHGLHTVAIDNYHPESITCVEAPNKFRSNEIFSRQNGSWVGLVKTEKFDFHYQDFSEYTANKTFDLLFYSGIIYHNIDQIGQLRKLHEIASPGAYLAFESSTTRTESLIDLNVIEVHHPPYSSMYRDVETCLFHPSKKACKSMLEITGWEIVDDSDNHEEFSSLDRISILCKKSTPKRNRHLVEK